MNYLTSYYKHLSEQLQAKINLLEAKLYSTGELARQDEVNDSLEEATMSKARRVGKKYPGAIDRAASAQKRRLPKKQKERDDLKGSAEFEAASEYADYATFKPYASGIDAENWWREARGENSNSEVGKAEQRVQDIIGNLAKLSMLTFGSNRRK
jgi:hypothetical protein